MGARMISKAGVRSLVVGAFVVALASGIAYASGSSGSSVVIHACFRVHGGRLRVIDPAAGGACRRNETATSWNQEGPAGLQGPPGPPGPPGTGGGAQAAVVSTPRNSDLFTLNTTPTQVATVHLDAGSYLVFATGTLTLRDGPTLADQPAGGSCQVQSPTAQPRGPASACARHPGAVANVLGVAAQSGEGVPDRLDHSARRDRQRTRPDCLRPGDHVHRPGEMDRPRGSSRRASMRSLSRPSRIPSGYLVTRAGAP